jgi:hypothetical protein
MVMPTMPKFNKAPAFIEAMPSTAAEDGTRARTQTTAPRLHS